MIAFVRISRKVNYNDISEEDQWWPTAKEAFGKQRTWNIEDSAVILSRNCGAKPTTIHF